MAGDLRDQLQSTLGNAYSLERELGGGGMSRVFLAHETRLGRTVVVKVLPNELAAGLSAERFEREIRLVAQLQHPSIVPVLSAGDTDGLAYYTMPFVAGLSLRARLAEGGAMPIAETVRILRDVARGLDYAHAHGVVHRDIKPENILLAGDGAVITDFGIAKAVSASRSIADATLTEAGTMLGTPQYMAPEQVAGDPNTDLRADVYAFGATAYEMLAGAAPFHGRAPHQILAAHVSEAPKPVAALRADTPAGLAALVMRCLEKDPSRRPQSARELLEALESVGTPGAASADGPAKRRRLAVSLWAAVLIVAALGGTLLWRRAPVAEQGASLAVIPFTNVGGDSAQEYFADGVSDELATTMGRLPGVHVAARSAAYRFRGRRDLDVRELGKALGVRYLVQGRVFRAGTTVRISAQLSDATNGEELWAKDFDHEFKDVLALQDEVSRAITTSLQPRLATRLDGRAPSPAAHGTTDPEAYDLYLRGEFFLRRRAVTSAAANYEKAIARDSGFARAYAGLAQALELFPYFTGTSTRDVAERAISAARRALAVDSSIARAHVALGMAQMAQWQWDSARAEYARAVALEPSDAETRIQFGRFKYYRGDDAGALEEWRRAREFDPYSGVVSAWMAVLLAETGRPSEATAEAERALDLDSTAAVVAQMSAEALILSGKKERARPITARLPDLSPWVGIRVFQRAQLGDASGIAGVMHALRDAKPMPWLGETALAYTYLAAGDTAHALDALERASDRNELWPSFERASGPVFDALRGNRRWAALLRRVGLDGVPGVLTPRELRSPRPR